MSEVARTRVLLVDDHVVLREGLRRILEAQPDVEVIGEAGSGEDALAQADGGEPDVVLMDVRMPGMDGIEATRRLLSAHPSVRVLVLSAYAEFANEALGAGAAGFVLKSGGSCRLLAALRGVMAGLTVTDSPQVGVRDGRRDLPRARLSSREGEILQLVAGGLTNRAIARQMAIAPRTADQHVHNIFVKVGVRTRAEAVRYAIEHEIVQGGSPGD